MIKKGEIWWASLGTPAGSEPGFRLPLLIVQADAYNRSALRTVIAAVLTSNLRLADAPGNVRLAKRVTGLKKDSVVNVTQIVTLDKSFLLQRVGRITARAQHDIDEGLRLVLALA